MLLCSESYGHARRARRVGYIDVTVGGSKQLRRPTSNFEKEFDQIWSSISGRSRHNLSRTSDLGSISGRYRVDLSRISYLVSISTRSRSTEIKITNRVISLISNNYTFYPELAPQAS